MSSNLALLGIEHCTNVKKNLTYCDGRKIIDEATEGDSTTLPQTPAIKSLIGADLVGQKDCFRAVFVN